MQGKASRTRNWVGCVCALVFACAHSAMAEVQVCGRTGEIVYLTECQGSDPSDEDWMKRVYIQDRIRGHRRVFYESATLWYFRASTKGELAVVESSCRLGETSPWNRLRILDTNGQVIATYSPDRSDIEIHYIEWSPDAPKIAMLLGTGLEIEDQDPLELWLLNRKNGSCTKIHDRAGELTWAQFDGLLYFWGSEDGEHAHVYQVSDDGLKQTPYKHLNFSPDGKYYLGDPDQEIDLLTIYERKTNEKVVPEGMRGMDPCIFERFCGDWLDSAWIHMRSRNTDSAPASYLLNIETGEFRKLESYVLHKIADSQTVLVITEERKIEERNLNKAPLASPSELRIPPRM